MREIKLIALDLDGTALRSDNTLSQKVRESLVKAAESGIELVAASGRPFQSMPKEILSLEGINYFITSNGAAVYDKSLKRIAQTPLKEQSVLRLLSLTAEYDLIWEAFTENATVTDKRYYDNPTAYGCTPAYVGYVKGSRGVESDMRRFIYENSARLDSVEYVCPDKALRESVRGIIADGAIDLYITSSSEHFVEFMDKNATKSNALKQVCEMLNIPSENIAACGNADNDADMLSFAGVGAAVENATALCKSAADIIIPPNDFDGVADFINSIVGR